MIKFVDIKRNAMETWLTTRIADLGSRLSVREAGLFFLDAQITDLENRCAANHQRLRHHDPARQVPAPCGTIRADTV